MNELPDGTSSRQIDWVALLLQTEGAEFLNPEHEVYRFSSKTFYETDEAGVYNDD